MRTVLVGTDFMYDNSGNLKPIEINTNVTLNPNSIIEKVEDVFNFEALEAFITNNNFTKLVYIGDIAELNQALSPFCNTHSIEYTYYNVGGDSLTVPYVEDGDDILIIRSAYDTTAIIDDTYCADKSNFLQLVGNSTFGLQYALTDSNGTLINTINEIKDNGVHPNFIIKSRYPNYDINVYPKLLKITTQTDLDKVIDSLGDQYILTEFLFNADKLLFGSHIQTIRSYNLLYPPTLESISLGQNTQIPELDLFSETPTYNTDTFELEDLSRGRYLTNVVRQSGHPKLRNTDKIEMADGTWKFPSELKEDDIIKTIVFPNPNNTDTTNESANFHMDYTTFVSGLTYTTAPLGYVIPLQTYSKIATITFTDGTTWTDGNVVSFLTLRDNEVRWVVSGDLINGDQLIGVNTTNTDDAAFDALLKTVSSVVVESTIFEGWIVSVKSAEHCYIVKDTTTDNTFALFEHNFGCGSCASCNGQCYVCPNKTQPYCNVQHICTAPNC